MTLADRRREGPPRTKRMECGVAIALRSLHPAEADELRDMIGDPAWRGAWIADAYAAEYPDGPKLPAQTITRHRGRECRCEPR